MRQPRQPKRRRATARRSPAPPPTPRPSPGGSRRTCRRKAGVNTPRPRDDRAEILGGLGASRKAFVGGDPPVQAVTYWPVDAEEKPFGAFPGYTLRPER